MNIVDALLDHEKDRAGHPAIEDGARTVTYGDLRRLVDAAAQRLLDIGVAPGEIVALRLADGADYLIVCLAVARMGGVIVSINETGTAADQERSISKLDVKWIVADRAEPPLSGRGMVPLEKVCAPASPGRDGLAWPSLPEGHPLLCRQSSGTTGVPKTAIWSHTQFQILEERTGGDVGWTRDDRLLQVVRLCFSYSRDTCLSLLQRGGTVVIDRSLSPEALVATIRDRRITYLSVTPAHVRLFLAQAVPGQLLFPDLRVMAFTSGALPEDVVRDAMRCVTPNVFQTLGTNEGCTLTIAEPKDLAAQPGSVGRVAEGLEVQFLDADGQSIPYGETGLIGFRGTGLPDAFHADPEASAWHFRDGWYYPGDLAEIDGEGYVFYKGRADDVINNQGAKFYPLEVEQVLLAHPEVEEVAVFGWPTHRSGETAIACFVGPRKLDIDEVQSFCRGRLASYKIPAYVVRANMLPKTASGKVVKTELKRQLQAILEKRFSR